MANDRDGHDSHDANSLARPAEAGHYDCGITMVESKLTIEERQAGDVTVLALTGQMLLDDGDLAFRKRIHDLIDRGFAKIVLDLGGVTYIDSSGVGMLVAKLKTLKEKGGDMKLLNLSRRAESLLGMVKLLILFETFQDEAAAVRSFGPSQLR